MLGRGNQDTKVGNAEKSNQDYNSPEQKPRMSIQNQHSAKIS